MSTDKGGRVEKAVVKDAVYLGGMCPRCEGMGQVSDIDRTALYDDSKSLREGALTVPGYSMDGWYGRLFEGMGLPMDKPIASLHRQAARHDALRAPDQDQGRGGQPHLRGHHPQDPEVDALQGPRGDAAARAALRGAGGHLPDLPGVRRHPPHLRGAGLEGQAARTSPSCARCRSATWRRGSASSTSRRWRRCSRGCGTCSTRSTRSGSATSPSTGRPARSRAARPSAPR